eukprot:8690876-Ditylum_brightwellii.AAC.1
MEKEPTKRTKTKTTHLLASAAVSIVVVIQERVFALEHAVWRHSPSSRAAVDISILQMELPDNTLDNGRSICVKQPYLDKIS